MTIVPNHVQETLKSVSIRGRMAMATACLENVLNEKQLVSPPITEMLELLWRFVEVDDLGEWDEQITKWYNEAGGISKNSKLAYLPNFILKMIEETIEVGSGNLYGGVVGYSNWTFDPLIKVLNLALENGFNIPPVEPFEKSKFSEFHGWGFAVSREIFSEATGRNNALEK